MSQQNLILLFVGAALLGLIAVVIDRLNFPQKRFRPKTVALEKKKRHRDRTGAHITDLADDATPTNQTQEHGEQ